LAYFLIVRGPLGAGKSTVSRALARALGGRVVSVDAVLETMRWDGGSEALFLKANERLAERVEALARRGVPAVVDGNFYWRSALDDLRRRLALPSAVFTLRVPLEVCVARDRGRRRSYGARATREVFAKVSRVRAGRPIDGTGEVPTIVQEIVRALPPREIGRGRPRRAPRRRTRS
jgi:predicted kinase